MLSSVRLGGIVVLTLALGLGACGDPGGETIEVSLADLPCQSLDSEGIWESTPFPVTPGCPWFFYAARTIYVFEHPLGRIPRDPVAFISFNEDGTQSTPASGDPFLVVEADASTITIQNGQNQPFWLRLVLQ